MQFWMHEHQQREAVIASTTENGALNEQKAERKAHEHEAPAE
jgi:hypothetical protein